MVSAAEELFPVSMKVIIYLYYVYYIFRDFCDQVLFFQVFFSHVFAVPLVACGSSNSMNFHNRSVKSWVLIASSSTSEVLLSKIFFGLQNQHSFLHMCTTLPLIKYYARQIVLCGTCTTS